MKYKATAALTINKRRPSRTYLKKTGETRYPVQLRIIYKREARFHSLSEWLTQEEFETVTTKNPRKKQLRDVKTRIENELHKARQIIEKLDPFSFDAFNSAYTAQAGDINNVYDQFQRHIENKKKLNKLSTASSYDLTVKALKKVKKRLTFQEVTPEFLERFEKKLTGEGLSLSTIGIYARNLRAVYNDAISQGWITKTQYPFGKSKYRIPATKNFKRALEPDEIEKLYNYDVIPGTMEAFAKDMWFFSYVTNGLNINDIARLKYRDLQGDNIIFYRQKTFDATKENRQKIVASVTPVTRNIIEAWGNEDDYKDNYIFPILNHRMTAEKERTTIQQTVKNINRHLKRIGEELEIPTKLTTYVARHSFAMMMKRFGAGQDFISESLGHRDLKTTKKYLDSFINDKNREYINRLTDFNNSE